MKNIYKQMTKAIALVALFLFAGNAWGTIETWTGPNTSLSLTNGVWNQLGSTSVYVQGMDIQYNPTNRGIRFGYVSGYQDTHNTNGLIKSTKDGVITITIQSYKVAEHLIVTDKTTGVSLTTDHSEGVTNVIGAGVSVTFEIKADREYFMEMSSKNAIYLKKVELYDEDEILTLDETAENAANKTTITGSTSKRCIKLNRTLKGGIWNTFCIPMTVSQAQLVISDGVYALGSYNSSTNELTFTKSTTLQANTPYLIMPAADVVNPAFVGTIVSPTAATATNNTINFVGVYGGENIYTTGDASSTKFYLNSTGHFVYPTSNTGNNGKIKGFRAYFEWVGSAPAHDVKAMTYIFEDDETGIITVEKDIFNENGNVYSIDGRLMGNSKENLSRGIYIQNGRKFIVK